MNKNRLISARATLLQVAEQLNNLEDQSAETRLTMTPSACLGPSTSSESPTNQVTQHSGMSNSMIPTSIPSTSRWGPNNHGTPKMTSVSSATLSSHRKLFNYSGGKASKGKRTKKESRIPTCSLKFLCMSSCSRERPPLSIKERTTLSNAGLGDTVITLNLDGDSAHLHEKLLEKFPKLGTAGYQLLLYHRSGAESAFCALNPPYAPRRLKELVGQCKIYIRPLQKDLIEESSNLSPAEELDVDDDCCIDDDNEPMVNCIICNIALKMSAVPAHHDLVHTCNSKPKEKKMRTLDSYLEEQPSNDGSRDSPQQTALADLVPSATSTEIETALNNANGNIEVAAQDLLGLADDLNFPDTIDIVDDEFEGKSDDMPTEFNLDRFRWDNVDDSAQRQQFVVSREEGLEDLKRDILGCYKRHDCNLRARMRVRFEGEDGAGSGPIREFLLCAMKIVQEGIGANGKPIIFFEGEDDHKLPVHEQTLRCTGAFRAVGRIIGHSVLHGGPFMYGLSTAVKLYWAATGGNRGQDTAAEALPIVVEDIPDIELRRCILQLQSIAPNETPSHELREELMPYLVEAGIDADRIGGDWNLVIQGLMLYFVIDKRRREIDEIAKGMNEVGLHSVLGGCSLKTVESIFPLSCMQKISVEQMKEVTSFEESEGHEDTIAMFFLYLDFLGKYEDDQLSLLDLCCFWSATNTLPARWGTLLVKFDDGTRKLPCSETYFNSLTLPIMHPTYQDFEKFMNIALKYGSLGIDNY